MITLRFRALAISLLSLPFGIAIRAQDHGLPLSSEQANVPNSEAEFEVASVKTASPNSTIIGIFTYPGGRVVASNCSLRLLIMSALDMDAHHILGGPRWIDTATFDVEGKPPETSLASQLSPSSPKGPLSREQRQMLLNLLEKRFQLNFHHDLVKGTVYHLTRTGSTLQLKPQADDKEYPWVGGVEGGAISLPTGLSGHNAPLPLLAKRIGAAIGRPVVDETGLQGSYDFECRSGEKDSSDVSVEYVIVHCLKELGLNLKLGPGLIDSIFIDSAMKPSPN